MENVKRRRKELGMTQLTLQMTTGIDQSNLSKIENGVRSPSAEQLAALSRALHTSADYLLGLTEEKEPYPRKE